MKPLILAVILGLFPTAQAFAEAQLVSSAPLAGGVAVDVVDVRLTFSEGVEAKSSTITLSAATGRPLATPAARLDPQDDRILRLTLPRPLAPGAYTVSWAVVSRDTHRTSGSFGFSVRP